MTKINLRELEKELEGKSIAESQTAHEWGVVSSVIYSMSFLDGSMRTAVRILSEDLSQYRSPKSIADCMRQISEVSSALADYYDDLSARMS